MKKIIASAVVVLIAVLVMPKLVGVVAKSKIDQRLAQLDAMPHNQIRWQSYDPGWWRSAGVIELSLSSQGDATIEPVVMLLKIDLEHGPWLNGTGLGLVSWRAKVVLSDTALSQVKLGVEGDLISSSGYIDLARDFYINATIAAFTAVLPNQSSVLKFAGLHAEGNYQGQVLQMSVNSKGMSVQHQAQTVLQLSGLSVSANADVQLFDFDMLQPIAGDFEVKLAQLQVQGEQSFTVNGFVASAANAIEQTGETMDMTASYSVAAATLGDWVMADIGVDMVINNYSVEFNRGYTQLMMQLSSSEDDPAQIMLGFQDELLELLKHDLELRLDNMRLTVNQGTLKSQLLIKLTDVTELPPSLLDPVFWLQHLTVEVSAQANQTMALTMMGQYISEQIKESQSGQISDLQISQMVQQQAPILLQGFADKRLLDKQGDQYVVKFTLVQGQALLNGNTVPLPLVN